MASFELNADLINKIKQATGRNKDGSWLDDYGTGIERAKHLLNRNDIDLEQVAEKLGVSVNDLNSDSYEIVSKLAQIDDALNIHEEIGEDMEKILKYMYDYCQKYIPDDATGRVFKKVILTDPRVAMEVYKTLKK
ncbi:MULTISPECIES: hypothetical protein [Lactobacillus]|jgi:hypothetical protein|uniref:hypothetical protein n=1 Tax=Lactobacillus TaxID=1578 RepID=UPI0001C04B4F|nr:MULTISPECIES: hypothetical protein [Lactobacillus]DAX31987.1 MAG TPA: repressor protein C2 [Caudoviricetes sp.]APT14749.1 hypothetical protein BUE77_04720 [Lactobacillus jensenii]MCF1778132.1 hypothetical protein [Lactobacillus jensenii]MCF1851253.1 hypothetical protein [Lactobacillus jensenii]MCW8081805.1 hypothetical protein [Lactobacillus jensenii]